MLALDVILLILTITSIGYCFILNRRILQIQRYREDLFKMLRDFEASIKEAENILKEIRLISPKAEQTLNELEAKSGNLTSSLKLLVMKADTLAEELETMIISGNKLALKLAAGEKVNSSNTDNLVVDEENVAEEILASSNGSFADEFSTELNLSISDQQKLSQEEYYKILQKIAKK